MDKNILIKELNFKFYDNVNDLKLLELIYKFNNNKNEIEFIKETLLQTLVAKNTSHRHLERKRIGIRGLDISKKYDSM